MVLSRAEFSPLRSLGFASISGVYANLGPALTVRCKVFKLTNQTDGDLIISTNGGIEDHIFMPAGTFTLYDVQTNTNSNKQDLTVFPIGTQFAVKQSTAPTEKAIYLETIE